MSEEMALLRRHFYFRSQMFRKADRRNLVLNAIFFGCVFSLFFFLALLLIKIYDEFVIYSYSDELSKFFAINITNETNTTIKARLLDNAEESIEILPNESGVIIHSTGYKEVYQIEFSIQIEDEQSKILKEVYVYGLPLNTNQIVIHENFSITQTLLKNKPKQLQSYLDTIQNKNRHRSESSY